MMTTIKTKYETITIDDKIIADYQRLITMPLDTEGLDGITVESCINNGYDVAVELLGLCTLAIWYDFESTAMYHAVHTARLYEIL